MTRPLTIIVFGALLGTLCAAASGLEARLSESRFRQRARNQQHPPGGRNPDRSLAPSVVAKGSHPIVIRGPATIGMESPPGSILLSVVILAAGADRCVIFPDEIVRKIGIQ